MDPLWLAVGFVLADSQNTTAAEEAWEKLPNGVLGRLANFEGERGMKIAG